MKTETTKSAKVFHFADFQKPDKSVRVEVIYFHPDEVAGRIHARTNKEDDLKLAEALRLIADDLERKANAA